MAVTISSTTPATGTLTSTGIGSGLDINGMVTKLMQIEQQPITLLQTQEASYQAKITAYASLKGAVSGFQTAAQALAAPATFSAQSVSVGNASVASVSADGTATLGSHTLEVTTLAQSQRLLGGTAYASTSTQVGTGTLTISFGSYNGGSFEQNPAKATKTIGISPSQGSLAGIRDAINGANAGVTASIINDGSGYRLMLTSNDSGSANAIKVTVANTSGSLTDVAYDASTGGVSNMTQSQAAKDAQFVLDGVAITKSSNVVSDAIAGITLNLTGTNLNSPTTFTVARNTAAIQTAVSNLVTAYNSAHTTISGLTAYDASTKTGSILLGDFAAQTVQAKLQSIMNTSLGFAGGGVTSLADIGISFKDDGSMTVDSSKLASVLADPTKDIGSLFTAMGKPTDSLVAFAASTSDTQPGSYAVNITTLATNGALSSPAPLSTSPLTDLTAGSQTLSMTIDGVAATVSLGSASYTDADLVNMLQSAINGTSAFSNAGVAVTVGMTGTRAGIAGSTAAPTTIGAGEKIDVTIDGNTITDIGLTAGTYTASELASMVQSQINTAFATLYPGTSVAVTQTNGVLSIKSNLYGAGSGITVADAASGGTTATKILGAASKTGAGSGTRALTITSNSFGASSNVNITDGTAAALGLFGGAAVAGTAGVDVAGTINGEAATGLGQILTATSGKANGLRLTISGGVTGDRGVVNFDRGIGDLLDTSLTQMLDDTSGPIAAATNGINQTIQSLQDQENLLQSQLASIQQMYLEQFNAMDRAVAQMQSTGSFLTQQLTALANSASSSSSKK